MSNLTRGHYKNLYCSKVLENVAQISKQSLWKCQDFLRKCQDFLYRAQMSLDSLSNCQDYANNSMYVNLVGQR